MQESSETPNTEELVFALCHEVRNLLAATRMHAHLLEADSDWAMLGSAAAKISRIAARSGSLLAQVRPLLSPPGRSSERVDPIDVLDHLRGSLDEGDELRVAIELEGAAGLPEVAADSECLHHLLLTAIFGALEASSSDQRTRVSAGWSGDAVAFVVEDDGPGGGMSPAPTLCGRALAWALAGAILCGLGGSLQVERGRDGTRAEYRVPTA